MDIKVCIAGKVSPNSVFGTSNWRDGFCQQLSEKSGHKIINLDPTKTRSQSGGLLDEKDSMLIVG